MAKFELESLIGAFIKSIFLQAEPFHEVNSTSNGFLLDDCRGIFTELLATMREVVSQL